MKHELIGKQFKTNEGYIVEVVNYENKNRVSILRLGSVGND